MSELVVNSEMSKEETMASTQHFETTEKSSMESFTGCTTAGNQSQITNFEARQEPTLDVSSQNQNQSSQIVPEAHEVPEAQVENVQTGTVLEKSEIVLEQSPIVPEQSEQLVVPSTPEHSPPEEPPVVEQPPVPETTPAATQLPAVPEPPPVAEEPPVANQQPIVTELSSVGTQPQAVDVPVQPQQPPVATQPPSVPQPSPVPEELPVPDPITETTSPVIERKEIKETLQEIIKEIDKEVIKDFQRSECKSVATGHSGTVTKQETSQMEQQQDSGSNYQAKSFSSFSVKKISSTGHSLWTPSGIIKKGSEQPFSESLSNSLTTLDNSPIPPVWIPPKVAYTPMTLPDLPDLPSSKGPTDVLLSQHKPSSNEAPARPDTLGLQNGDINQMSGPDMPTCRKLSEEELKKIFTPAEDADLISPSAAGRKMYASSYFYSDSKNLYPTVEEQLKLAKKISDSLSSDTNKESKGQDMFERRKKRSHKWVHEEVSGGHGYSSTTHEAHSTTFNSQTTEQSMTTSSHKHPLKLVLNPVSMRDWSATKQGIYADIASAMSPEICADLVKDLQQPKGKGAMLFAKRKKKSENWIVDSANRKNPAEAAVGAAPPPPKPTAGVVAPPYAYTAPVTSAGRARASQNQKLEEIQMRLAQPKVKLIKSPWEAALTTGSVDTAFQPTPPPAAPAPLFPDFSEPITSLPPPQLPTPPLVAEPPAQLLPRSELLKPNKPQPWDDRSTGYTPTPEPPKYTPKVEPTPQPIVQAADRRSQDFGNYNTAARGWGQFQNYYRPVTFSSAS